MNKKRKNNTEIDKQDKQEFINCFNDLKDLIERGEIGESEMSKLTEYMSNLKMKKTPNSELIPTKKGKNDWVDNLHEDVVKQFSTLFEMLDIWIDPYQSGSTGMQGKIFCHVSDPQMEQMVDDLKKNKHWKLIEGKLGLQSFPYSNVKSYKFQTTDESVVMDLLKRFEINKEVLIHERHFMYNMNKKGIYHPIDLEKANKMSYMIEKCEEMGMNYIYQNIGTASTKMVFGKHFKSGIQTSSQVLINKQKFPTKDKKIVGDEKVDPKEDAPKEKKKRGKSLGRFTIQYLKAVYPKNKVGILRINCKYRLHLFHHYLKK